MTLHRLRHLLRRPNFLLCHPTWPSVDAKKRPSPKTGAWRNLAEWTWPNMQSELVDEPSRPSYSSLTGMALS
jgi:hypothetical protein